MVWIEPGEFAMGSEDFYPEERPVHRVAVDGFWIDARPVTAAEYRRFVRETGYVTVAERPLEPEQYPDADPALLQPGSLVFRKAPGPTPLTDIRNWWRYVPGAYWKRPGGPGTTINGRDNHPVVHMAWEDVDCVRGVGREGAAHGGRVGARRPRRAGRRDLRLGGRALPGRQADGEYLAGTVPLGEPEVRRT